MERSYSCPECRLEFNLSDRIPKIAYWGETYCEQCLPSVVANYAWWSCDENEAPHENKLLSDCPIDKKVQSYLLYGKWGSCNQHNTGIKYVCLDHKLLLCDTCILNKSHSGHDIIKAEEIAEKIKTKYLKPESERKVLAFLRRSIHILLAKRPHELQRQTGRCFKALQNALHAMEKKLVNNISIYTDLERENFKNIHSEINSKELKTYTECIKTKKNLGTFRIQQASQLLSSTLDEKYVVKACEITHQKIKIESKALENRLLERLDTLISQEVPFKLANPLYRTLPFENDKLYSVIDSPFRISSSNNGLEIILAQNIQESIKFMPEDWNLSNKMLLRIEKSLQIEDIHVLKYILSKIDKISNIKLIVRNYASLGRRIRNLRGKELQSGLNDAHDVFSILFRTETLYNLDIDFSKAEKDFIEKDVEDLIQIYLPNIINLKTVRLNLFPSKISSEILRDLGPSCQKLNSLISLDLDIGGNMQNKNHNIFDFLKNMPQWLRAIKLGLNDVNHFMLNKTDMESLFEGISAIKGLESLEISLRNTGMTDEKAKYVLDLLESHMKSFRVNLKNNFEVTDALVKPFLEKVANMKNLDHFYLDVSRTKVTKETLKIAEIFNQK